MLIPSRSELVAELRGRGGTHAIGIRGAAPGWLAATWLFAFSPGLSGLPDVPVDSRAGCHLSTGPQPARTWAANEGQVELAIGEPKATRDKLDLYDRFHLFQHGHKGWSVHGPTTANDYIESFVDHPFPTEEWCYFRDGRLIGVGYVDALPAGLSAIYFFYDPAERDHSPGTFNVLSILRRRPLHHLPHVYLGYYVEGCRSLEYKARFRPNEVLDGMANGDCSAPDRLGAA